MRSLADIDRYAAEDTEELRRFAAQKLAHEKLGQRRTSLPALTVLSTSRVVNKRTTRTPGLLPSSLIRLTGFLFLLDRRFPFTDHKAGPVIQWLSFRERENRLPRKG